MKDNKNIDVFSNYSFKSKKLLIFPFVILLFFAYSIDAQVKKKIDNHALISSIFKKIYDFSFHEADSLVLIASRTDVDKATILNIKANLAWWKLLSGDKMNQNFKNCNDNINESIKILLKDNQQDNSALLNMINAYSLKARLENYRGNVFKSLPNFFHSIAYIEDCINIPVKDEEMYLVVGLYYYFMDYIENKYFMLRALLGSFPKGNKRLGLQYLDDCSKSKNEIIRNEANYFLLKIYANTERNQLKAYKYSKNLTDEHPNNLIYSLEKLKILLALNKNIEAQLYKNELIVNIKNANYMNIQQKDHFNSQIQKIKFNNE